MLARFNRLPVRSRRALIGSASLAALFVCVWYAVFHVSRVAGWDASIFSGFRGLRAHPPVNRLASLVANLCNPSPYVYLAAVPVAVAIWRRRPLLAATILAILLAANETTHVLKPLLAAGKPVPYGSFEPLPGSFPSGHSTAAMTLALCAVIASPPRARRYVAVLGAVFAVGVMYSVVTLGWHYPSDVLGGLLVASSWTLLGMAVLFALEARRGYTARAAGNRFGLGRELAPVAIGALGVLGVLVAVVLVRPTAAISYAADHTAFVAGAAGLLCLSVAVATAVMVTLRR